MESENKNINDLVASAYWVRTGLSNMSLSADAMRSIEEEITKLKKTNEEYIQIQKLKYKSDSEAREVKINSLRKKFCRLNEEKYQINKDLKAKKNLRVNIAAEGALGIYRKSGNAVVRPFLFIIIACVVLCIWIGLFALMGSDVILKVFGGPIKVCFLVIGITVFIITLYSSIIARRGKKIKNAKLNDIDYQIKELESYLNNVSKEAADTEEAIDDLNANKPKIEDYDMDKYVRTIDEMESERDNETIPMLVKGTEAILTLLSFRCGSLCEDDWRNIDLIIYYLKTGKANSLETAVFKVNQLIINNEIDSHLEIASKFVTKDISENLHELSYLENMRDALVKKADVSSVELMKDFTYNQSFIK